MFGGCALVGMAFAVLSGIPIGAGVLHDGDWVFGVAVVAPLPPMGVLIIWDHRTGFLRKRARAAVERGRKKLP